MQEKNEVLSKEFINAVETLNNWFNNQERTEKHSKVETNAFAQNNCRRRKFAESSSELSLEKDTKARICSQVTGNKMDKGNGVITKQSSMESLYPTVIKKEIYGKHVLV